MRLRKPTHSDRATVDMNIRTIVLPEEGADASAVRKITLLTPESPDVAYAILPHTIRNFATGASVTFTKPSDFGLNRSYEMADLPTAATVHFHIRADQSIVAVSKSAFAQMSVIVEYLE